MTIYMDEENKRKWKEFLDAMEARSKAWDNFEELGKQAYDDAVTREMIAKSRLDYPNKGQPEFVRRFDAAKQEYEAAMKQYEGIPTEYGGVARTREQEKIIQRVRAAIKRILAAYEDE